MDSPWPMKGQNLKHTGLSPYNINNNTGVVYWRYKINNWIESGMSVDKNGIIYFGGFDNFLNAIYPNKTIKWRFRVDGWIWSTPAIAEDGTIYIGTFENTFYSINNDGSLKWKFITNSSITSSPAIDENNCIYFGTMGFPENGGCKVICLYPNGTKKWDFQTGYKITSDPAIDDYGTIYIGSGDSYLYSLNPDGTQKWRFKTGEMVKSHPSIGEDGTIYFDSFDGNLYAVHPNGTLKWKLLGVGCGCANVCIDNEGVIYTGGNGLTAILPNGTILWYQPFGQDLNSHHSSPAISADGTIFIGVSNINNNGGYIFAFNRNGMKQWDRKIGGYLVTSSPCISKNGVVYIGSASHDPLTDEAGYLYAFKRNDTNQRPNPPIIIGNSVGSSDIPQTLAFIVSDQDLDNIELYIDWGDETDTSWIGPYDSGEEVTIEHTWTGNGQFQIRAKARDTYDGSESDWSTMSVIMPKYKTHHPLYEIIINILTVLQNIREI